MLASFLLYFSCWGACWKRKHVLGGAVSCKDVAKSAACRQHKATISHLWMPTRILTGSPVVGSVTRDADRSTAASGAQTLRTGGERPELRVLELR